MICIKNKLRKYKKLFNLLSFIKLHIKGLYQSLFLLIFRIFPIAKNKIMIVSYAGKGYGDNGKYISEKLLEEKFNIYWACKKEYKKTLPSGIKYVKYGSIMYLFHLATSKIWFNNSRFEYGIIKRKKQFYIQTWHSSLRLKMIEKDALDLLSPQYIKTCKKDSKLIDVIISGCDFSTKIYQNSFWYNGDILKIGTPRCDIFFNQNKMEKIRKNYSIPKNKKIILYAPTFRKNFNEKFCYMDFDYVSKNLNENYILLVRFHPISKYTIDDKYKNVINVTFYPDMQELILISDFLITDYSGCSFDMMIKGNPCILLTKDLKEYLDKERNLYFKFSDLPFPIVKDEEELLKTIDNFDYKKYQNKVNKFIKKIGSYEKGTACDEILKIVKEKTK